MENIPVYRLISCRNNHANKYYMPKAEKYCFLFSPFATPLLENGVNIRVVQELMGHADVKTTEIDTHVMQKDLNAVVSPLDSSL